MYHHDYSSASTHLDYNLLSIQKNHQKCCIYSKSLISKRSIECMMVDTSNEPMEKSIKLSSNETEKKFQKMYILDKKVIKRNNIILKSSDLKHILKKAKDLKSSLHLLDKVVPDEKLSLKIRLSRIIDPFYKKNQYSSKEDYLQYLKQIYGFLITPFEEPPNWFWNTYHANNLIWEPSPKTARKLLRQFYLEVELIRAIPNSTWSMVKHSNNPEGMIFKHIYGIKYSPKFKTFLSSIPWRSSQEPYGAPGLDLVFWRTPGPELSKKPMAVDLSYIERLVQSVKDKEAYRELYLENNDSYSQLRSTNQVISEIRQNDKATIDTYVGISKRESDFILHQRILIWENPAIKHDKKFMKKGQKKHKIPSRYFVSIHERVIPLEIPFIGAMEIKNSDVSQNRK